MKPSVKQKWVKALRSGEYVQGKVFLVSTSKRGDRFCCLGVLCELHAKETGNAWEEEEDERELWYLGREKLLPPAVVTWARLESEDPCINDSDNDLCQLLSELNDAGYSFKKIAKLIEKYL